MEFTYSDFDVSRRTNELKSEVDIPDDVMKKFEQFWSECRDTPLRGATNLYIFIVCCSCRDADNIPVFLSLENSDWSILCALEL